MNQNDDLVKKITRHLDHSIEHLEPGLQRQINTIRQEALERHEKRSFRSLFKFPVTGLAGVVAVVLITFFVFHSTQDRDMDLAKLEMVEMLSSEPDFELYEDLEFFTWMAEHPDLDPADDLDS